MANLKDDNNLIDSSNSFIEENTEYNQTNRNQNNEQNYFNDLFNIETRQKTKAKKTVKFNDNIVHINVESYKQYNLENTADENYNEEEEIVDNDGEKKDNNDNKDNKYNKDNKNEDNNQNNIKRARRKDKNVSCTCKIF